MSVQTDRGAFVDSSLAFKAPCRVATTAPITLSGIQTIDGVTLAAGDRVLVKNQADGSQNGIYVAATTSWSRDADFAAQGAVTKGTEVRVNEGAVSGGFFYAVTTSPPITIGTTSIAFASVGGPGTVSAAMAPVVAAATLAAARTKFGGTTGGNAVFTAASQAGALAALAALGTAGGQVDGAITMRAPLETWIDGSVVAASTTPIGSASGNLVIVSGSTTINNFDAPPQSGSWRILSFANAPLIKAALISLPGGNDIQASAGDMAMAIYISPTWHIPFYQRADGGPVVPTTHAFTKSFSSGEQAITLGGVLTIAHGLGALPFGASAWLKCVTNEAGHTAGEIVKWEAGWENDGTNPRGLDIRTDATNIIVRFGTANINGIDASSGALFTLTPANWHLIMRAWV
jgi:hypothetical protein